MPISVDEFAAEAAGWLAENGEPKPIEMSEDERAWGTRLFGKGGKNGAVYLTIKAPFASSVVVTAQIPEGLHPAGEMFNNQTAEMARETDSLIKRPCARPP